ncbi:hypothetical protein [Vibrio cholerae]|uniref:Uncharacterized protein n=2 Tax=Vibrio cholerae TaxID=666 RepID=A0A0H3AGU5_VIBC3|nr:hypothetical protein [Vibrio cholerae]ABQ19607.1 conserved hypothetical protein [Vibrio cholerae O395]ABQ19608.1 conserved hypothetical protein [Vibrio cholerae O395]ACP09190.1 hypothetical protein VC395_1180 [Vibrio cholerae O395]ACP09260.1 hypothetical protein VC395_1251 [Vibrio cholerae O395]EEY40095.1 hypothetical protein VIJ_003481 [Vibrio cholerae RC27]
MSETAKTRSRKSATKPAVEGSDQQTVAENTPVPAAQAEPEQVANPEPPQAMPEPQASADEKKSEQDAQMTGSQTEVKQDEEAKEESPMGAAVQLSVHAGRDLDISGAFKVRAKSDQGFWRAGIQFLRTKETVLLVVDQVPEDQPKTVAQEDGEPELVLFVTPQAAKRIHGEPNLVVEVVEVSDVIDVSDTE